jgi:hypothetical protein
MPTAGNLLHLGRFREQVAHPAFQARNFSVTEDASAIQAETNWNIHLRCYGPTAVPRGLKDPALKGRPSAIVEKRITGGFDYSHRRNPSVLVDRNAQDDEASVARPA